MQSVLPLHFMPGETVQGHGKARIELEGRREGSDVSWWECAHWSCALEEPLGEVVHIYFVTG